MDSTSLIPPEHDPMGRAIADYHRDGHAPNIKVRSTMLEDDVMPVKVLFRDFDHMPAVEQQALRLADGAILDVGAAAGCHALCLQRMGKQVCAIDISTLSVETMRSRGVNDARAINFFDPRLCQRFDTILLLMNGAGMMQRMENMPMFFARLRQLLTPGGKVLMDSTDLVYLYENGEGGYDIPIGGDYYGQVDFEMHYRGTSGGSFDWLYIDFATLQAQAEAQGFSCEKVVDGPHYDYLALLRPAITSDNENATDNG